MAQNMMLIRHFLSEGRYEDAFALAAEPGMCLQQGHRRRNTLGEAIARNVPFWVIERILKICPEAAQNVDAEGFTPLHQAINSGREDQTELVKMLLPAFPGAAAIPILGGFLPIFTSVFYYPDLETFHLLYDAYPVGIVEKDELGQSLLHHAVRTSFGISKAILELRPDAIKDVDRAGWLPIHTFCKGGKINMAREIFWLLYNAYPEAVHAPLDEVEDGTIVHMAVQNWLLPDDIADFLIKELPEAAAKLAGRGKDGLPFRCI